MNYTTDWSLQQARALAEQLARALVEHKARAVAEQQTLTTLEAEQHFSNVPGQSLVASCRYSLCFK